MASFVWTSDFYLSIINIDVILKPVFSYAVHHIDKRGSQSVQAWLLHTTEMSNLLSSLDHTMWRRIIWGHILNSWVSNSAHHIVCKKIQTFILSDTGTWFCHL